MQICPHVSGLDRSLDWTDAEALRNGLALPLTWLAGDRDRFRGGIVRLGWDEFGLRVFASLEDEHLYTRASADNQLLYELGDVFELFLKWRPSPDYFELHTVHTGHRLQLHFPGADAFDRLRHGVGALEDFVVHPPLFTFLTRQTSQGWDVIAMVPFSIFGVSQRTLAGSEFQVSFGRYDYEDADSPPILSSTTQHGVLDFHRLHEWTTMRLDRVATPM